MKPTTVMPAQAGIQIIFIIRAFAKNDMMV